MTAAPRVACSPGAWLAAPWSWLAIAAAYLITRPSRLTLTPLFADEGIDLWFGRQLLQGDLSRGWGQGKPLAGWLIALPLALGANQVLTTRLGCVVAAALALAALAKLPVSMLCFGLPAGLLLVSPAARGRAGRMNAAPLYILPVLFAAGVVAVGAYRWSAQAFPIGFGFDEILLKSAANDQRGRLIAGNLGALMSWGGAYLAWPVTLAPAAAWIAAWIGPPLARLLAGASGLWLAIFVSAAGFWVPRYVWPVLPALLLLLGWGAASALERLVARLGKPFGQARLQLVGLCLGAAAVVALALLTMRLTGAILMNPSSGRLPDIDRQGYVTRFGSGYGFPEAAAYLGAALPSRATTTQVVALTVNDEARLRAYLPPALWPRLRQVHIVGGQNQDSAHQMALLRAWLPDAGVTYVIVASGIQWGPDWQQAFPQAILDQKFPKPGGEDAVEVRLIAAP
jgi:hypothetical protein